MKTVLLMIVSILPLFSAFIGTIQDESKNIEFKSVSETISVDVNKRQTTLEMAYIINNNHSRDLSSIALRLDVYLEGNHQKEVNFVIPLEVKHHRSMGDTYEYVYEDLFFDEVRLVSYTVYDKSFLASYDNTIFLGVFFNVVLVFAYYVAMKSNQYLLSDLNDVLIYQWYYSVPVVVGIPAIVSMLTFVGRYEVLGTIYGWIYFLASILSFPLFYLAFVIYHHFRDNKIIIK